MMERRPWGVAALIGCIGVFVAGCGTTPVSKERAAMEERQMLEPFLKDRTVVCNDLLVEITPNFHLNVSNPGVDKRQQRFDRVEKEALVEKVWSNLTGTRAAWFTVTIGEVSDPTDVSGKSGPRTTYKVMNQFMMRIRERGQMTISARASGPVVVVNEAGMARSVREFSIVNGDLEK
jgi:hypothetical protein